MIGLLISRRERVCKTAHCFFNFRNTNAAALSTITEMSKEHSSSRPPSQKTPLETINEAERNEECSKNDSAEVIPDPFDTDLIDQLLQKIAFPRPEHIDGYNQINCDMAQMKLSSVVKLGGFEFSLYHISAFCAEIVPRSSFPGNNKYNIIGEIGKGSYARILKLQDVKVSSQSIALKQQKPACPWEFYISKEIQRRLKTDLEVNLEENAMHCLVVKVDL